MVVKPSKCMFVENIINQGVISNLNLEQTERPVILLQQTSSKLTVVSIYEIGRTAESKFRDVVHD